MLTAEDKTVVFFLPCSFLVLIIRVAECFSELNSLIFKKWDLLFPFYRKEIEACGNEDPKASNSFWKPIFAVYSGHSVQAPQFQLYSIVTSMNQNHTAG